MKRLLIIIPLLITAVYTANAQKLPKIQEGSVWAPDNIKIDGKTNEWNDQFQAHNVSNFMFYTLSNNNDNLHLTVRLYGDYAGKKILKAGLTFTIIPASGNEDKLSVTFPALTDERKPLGSVWPMSPMQNSPYTYKILNQNPQANKQRIDSLISTSNKQLKEFFKDIHVTGIKEITDTVISVYNPQGIRVESSFNNQMDYIYELAIPLKYLSNGNNKGENFRYNIKLNYQRPIHVPGGGKLGGPKVFTGVQKNGQPLFTPEMIFQFTETDFSGEYTLAKKK